MPFHPPKVKFSPSILVFIFFSCFLLACSNTQEKKENGAKKALDIPFTRYVLDNGLTVLIHEDHSDPVAHIDVTYHVGSAREELGKSGFAHLFEHMMFQGSENVADEEHIKLVTEAGGSMNGTTNRDRTNYFETVPANHLETMLWLEADRMGFFLEAITQEKFEVQRATVKNEKQQNYDNRAYGRAFELITKALYPYGHPYSWLTIGDLEDLDRANAKDLRNFFLRWYGPNNATLTIGGDVNPKQVMAWVEKYFGGIARGPQVNPIRIDGFTLERDRYVSYYDDKIRFPAVTLSFPTVPRFHPDAPALLCLSEILGQGKGSYLYQNLVAPRLAIQASASHSAEELAGEFFMFVLPFPGKSLSEFEQQLRQSLDEFEKNGVHDTDLQKFKATYESKFIHGLEKVSGKVSQLAYYATFANDPSYLNKELAAHLAVTKEDVMRVYTTYIKNKPGVILSILDKPDGLPAKPDNYTPIIAGHNPYPITDYSKLHYQKVNDDFDRSVKPQPQKAELVSPPEYWEEQSNNGITIIGTNTSELPTTTIKLSLPGGDALDNLHPNKLGLPNITAAMLNTSTQSYSEKAIAEELEKIGSSISFSSQAQRFTIHINSLNKHLDRTLELFEEKLLRPAFKDEDFKRIQNQTLENVKSSTKQASSIARIVYDRLTYGEEHPFGRPPTDLIPTIPKITTNDTKAFYKNHFSPEGAELVIVGDIEKKEALSKLNFLLNWKKPQGGAATFPETPNDEKAKLYLVDKAGAAQSEIRIGYLTELPYSATGEYFRRYLMNFTLGGAFNSRINLNLREDKGVTYGARSYFQGSELPGPFTISTSVKTGSTALAIEEILKEIKLIREHGISEEELNFLKQAIGQRDALKYESNSQKSNFLAHILRHDIDRHYISEQKKIVSHIQREDILSLAKKHLPLEKMNIIVVGDKQTIYPSLQTLGYEIVELDESGHSIDAL